MFRGSSEKTTPGAFELSADGARCVSWNAIILPALIALGLSFLLHIFTAGLGLTVFTLNPEGQLSLAMGGFVWLLLASYAIMFLVGYIAGAFVKPCRCLGALHGFTAWCLALVVLAALFSNSTAGALGTPTYYSLNSPASTVQADAKAQPVHATLEGKEVANKLGVGILAIFFIFLSGALGSGVGGYVGSRPKEEEEELKSSK